MSESKQKLITAFVLYLIFAISIIYLGETYGWGDEAYYNHQMTKGE